MNALTLSATAPSVAAPVVADTTRTGLAGQAERLLLAAGAFQIALLLPSLVAYGLDDRLVNDINVWIKPIKFQLSLLMLMVTLVWLLPLLPAVIRAGRTIRWTALAVSFSAVIEIAYITLQSARGVASHFNNSSPVEAVAYGIMGLGAVTLVLGSSLIGLMIWRHADQNFGQGLRSGAAWGLMLGGILTLITAGLMSSGTVVEPGHWVGGIRSDANGLFLFGWSSTGGDLRVPHFFATHIMQALPILGLIADRFTPGQVRPVMWAGAVLSVAVVALTLVQALAGLPFYV